MPKKKQTGPPRASAPHTPNRAVGDGALMKTRIDPPHQIATADPDLAAEHATPHAADMPHSAPVASHSSGQREPAQPAPFVIPLAQTFEQMQNQAAQLAAQLSKQQSSLDHREAEVNARAAAVESQVRVARLWLVEKLDELAQRAAEVTAAATDDTRPRASHVPRPADQDSSPSGALGPSVFEDGSADDGPTEQFGELLSRKHSDWQEKFERWRSAREASSDSLAATSGAATGNTATGNEERAHRSSSQSGATVETERQLASRAAELEALRCDLAAERETLESEREAFVAERQADLYRLADQRRVMSEKLMRQRARLRRRRDDFDAREMALRQLRAELLRMQQQTLEMRLGAEEQWVRERGKGPA